MVKYCWFNFFCLLLAFAMVEATPVVDASIDVLRAHARYPIPGTITITHSKSEKIDSQSFKMDEKPLDVSFVNDVPMSASSDTLVSIYSFQLPPQEKGLYALPSIELKIGGKTYQTIPSSYQVDEEEAPSPTPTSEKAATPLIFSLQASVIGPTTLFPGERTKLFYRISYNRNIDLNRSELPMIHPAHFKKVGDVQIKDYQEREMTLQDLTQEVEASDIGTFQLGPSLIEGYTYTLKGVQKVYDPTLLQAKAPIVTLEVKPFPKEGQPPSFSGALGKIKGEASLESSNSVSVGDTIQLLVKIEGVSNLIAMSFPLLQCQPGFSGFFQTSDLPPLAEVKEEAKFFHIELRPLTALIREIPSIELSSFDPEGNQYVITKTQAIPLTIMTHQPHKPYTNSLPVISPLAQIPTWPTPQLGPLEFEGSPVKLSGNTWIKSGSMLWLLLIGLLLLLLQAYWHFKLKHKPRVQQPKSERLFKQALKQDFSNLQVLEQAFWHRLWEKGKLAKGHFHLEDLELQPVRSFLYELQALQYSSDKTYDAKQLKRQAKELFEAI